MTARVLHVHRFVLGRIKTGGTKVRYQCTGCPFWERWLKLRDPRPDNTPVKITVTTYNEPTHQQCITKRADLTNQYSKLSADDLRTKAANANIQGRSKMRKDDLIVALVDFDMQYWFDKRSVN